jgi:hypothetical protein
MERLLPCLLSRLRSFFRPKQRPNPKRRKSPRLIAASNALAVLQADAKAKGLANPEQIIKDYRAEIAKQ